MDKIVLDEELRSHLNGMQSEIEVCDIDGTTVGRFVPQERYEKMLYAWVQSQCPVSDEELDRRRKNKGRGRPLADIWRDLGVK